MSENYELKLNLIFHEIKVYNFLSLENKNKILVTNYGKKNIWHFFFKSRNETFKAQEIIIVMNVTSI